MYIYEPRHADPSDCYFCIFLLIPVCYLYFDRLGAIVQ